MEESKRRNAEIDFYRILLAFVIVIVHTNGLQPPDTAKYPFVGGYLAVEFFFMLSGYFATEKVVNSLDAQYKNVPVWMWRKFKNIFAFVIPAVIVHYLVKACIAKMSLFGTAKSLLYGVFEMLLLPVTGLSETFLVLPLWYLSAMLILLPLFYAALLKEKDFFLYIFCPIFVLMIYGYYSVTTQHIDRWADWNGLFYMSLPRAWAGLCLGGIVNRVAEYLRGLSFTPKGSLFLSGVEFICFGIVMVYMYTRAWRRLDFLCIGLLAVVASIALSEKASAHKAFPVWFSKISEFSLALYVSHWTIRLLIPTVIMPTASYEVWILPYIVLSVAYAMLLMLLVSAIRRLKLAERFKQLLFQ